MELTARLFDALDYQLKHFPKHDMLVAKENGNWKNYSTKTVVETVNKLSASLLNMGVNGKDYTPEGSDKIAIISTNRPEWVFVDLAVQQTGAILVPIYPTTNPIELEFILNDASVQYIFVNNQEMYDKVQSIQSNVPSLKDVFSFDEIPHVKHWSSLLNTPSENEYNKLEEIKSSIPQTHVATFIYTSGTTGKPKGVMLTHKNIISNVYYSKQSFPFPDQPETKVLSFLPLNHIFEKMITYLYLYSGISVYYAENLETIGDNLKEVKPNGFTTVPRLLEKVYEKIMVKGNELTGFKRKLFYWAIDLGKQYNNNKSMGIGYNIQLAIANKLIFNKWREALGGNISFIITGGAACRIDLLRIFNAAKIPVYEGYGPTEFSPVIAVNRLKKTNFGTVGPIIDGIEMKLEQDGEICVKGDSMMLGYYKQKDLTNEVIIDGWLHTGDIGVMVENSFLKITDRKKEMFKTSGGKYVAPQPIEQKMKESSLIEQVMVIGADKKFVSALIVPNFLNLKEWMKAKNIAFTTNEDVVHHPKILELYKEIVESFNLQFNHVEQIKKFELLPREWSIETGEMTPKLSLKRKVVMEKFQTAINRLYD